MEKDKLIKFIEKELKAHKKEFIDINKFIYSNPEIDFREYKASSYLKEYLENKNFEVFEMDNLPTSFCARYGKDGRRVGIIVEYDAVSYELGHACGHNLIASAGVGAAVLIKNYLANSGHKGQIEVWGTPAEESGGGKVLMIKEGAFEELDAAYYIHPSNSNRIGGRSLATTVIKASFTGKSAHAARRPEEGINSVKAMNSFLMLIDNLHQQMYRGTKINSYIDKGGEMTSSINEYAECKLQVFTLEEDHLSHAVSQIERVAEGIETIFNCTVKMDVGPYYLPRQTNNVLAKAMEDTMKNDLNLEVEEMPQQEYGYTDMGNVSEVCPAVQGYLTLDPDVKNHTERFANLAGNKEGEELIERMILVNALFGLKLLLDDNLLQRAKKEFTEKR